MQVKFKKLSKNAVIPSYSNVGDAGMDLVATTKTRNEQFGFIEYGTDIAVEIPEGYVGLIFPRSSISKTYHSLSNSVGVIDSSYRGPISFRFFANGPHVFKSLYKSGIINLEFELKNSLYEIGDRIGQLIIMPYPKIEPIEVDELTETARGSGGFGSTGK